MVGQSRNPNWSIPVTFHSTIVELLGEGWHGRRDDEARTPWLLAPDRAEVG
jgi:hypothetical protein